MAASRSLTTTATWSIDLTPWVGNGDMCERSLGFPFSVFRFPFSVFRFPFSVFRYIVAPVTVFRAAHTRVETSGQEHEASPRLGCAARVVALPCDATFRLRVFAPRLLDCSSARLRSTPPSGCG